MTPARPRNIRDALPRAEPLEKRTMATASLELTGPTLAAFDAPVTSVVVADLNGDHVQDIAVASGRRILLLKGMGNGMFDAPRTAATLRADVGLLSIASLDGDPQPTLVAAQRSQSPIGTGWLRTLRFDGNAQFTVIERTRMRGRPTSVTLGNLDGDEHRDILLTIEGYLPETGMARRAALDWYEPSGTGLVFRKRLDWASRPHWDDVHVFPIMLPESPPVVSDLDGDGRDEVIALASMELNRSRMRLLQWSDGAGTISTSEVMLHTNVLSAVLADPTGSGHAELLYAAQTDFSEDYYDPTTESIGTIELASRSGVPVLGTPGPDLWTRTAADSQGLVGWGPARSLRIAAARDLNGDGRMDIALEAMNQGAWYGNDTVLGGLTQLVQDQGGVFRTADTHVSVLDDVPPSYRNDVNRSIPFYTFAELRGNGMLDALTLTYRRGQPTDLSRPSLMLLRATAAWKPPEVRRAAYYGSGPGNPGAARWIVDVASAELARGARIAQARVYYDTNGNGALDNGDELLGTGSSRKYANYPTTMDETWEVEGMLPAVGDSTPNALFAVAIDSSGAVSEPFRVR